MKSPEAKAPQKKGRRRLLGQHGQTVIEYLLILLVVIAIAMRVKNTLTTKSDEWVNTLDQRFNEFVQ